MNPNRYTTAMNTNLSFGEWLEDELIRRGWQQSDLAEYLRMSESSISSWKSGTKPRRTTCRRIAEALNIDENEVLYRAGRAPKDPNYRLPENRTRSVGEEVPEYRYQFPADDEEFRRLFMEVAREMVRREDAKKQQEEE